MVADEHVPFWVNHIQASPPRPRLFCQEGPWQRQLSGSLTLRSYVGTLREQEDGVAIGHEFWLDEATVAYHGTLPDKPDSSAASTSPRRLHGNPSAEGERSTPLPHVPGRAPRDHRRRDNVRQISIAHLTPSASPSHHRTPRWVRAKDQRHHPHPHWHASAASSLLPAAMRRHAGAPAGRGRLRLRVAGLHPFRSPR